MKKFTFLYLIVICAIGLIVSGYTGGAANHNIEGTGAETGLGNSAGCGNGCHTAATTTTVTIELDSAGIPTTRYKGGMNYTVKITGKNTSTTSLPKFGFQLGSIVGSSASATPVNAGTWATPYPAGTQYVAPKAGKFVVGVMEQTAALAATSGTGGNGTTYVRTFNWTAPASGTGTISFWGVLNAVNGSNNDAGDKYNNAKLVITELVSTAALTVKTSAMDVKCFGDKTGAATATATGTSPYTYSWNTSPVQTTATATGLAAGTYTVTVKDATGKTATATATISQPAAALLANVTSTAISCNGGANGSATVTATGGTPPYTYMWSNMQSNATILGLAAATYTVTVKDGNACSKTAIVTVEQPVALTLSTNVVNLTCNGDNNGSATVVATGGTAPYTYAWNNGKTTATASGLTAGTYTVTVTDTKGCTKTASATITQPLTPVLCTTTKTDANCNTANGTATANATGGTGPYTYSWSNGKTTANITGLAANLYTVTVTDTKGCSAISSVNINNLGGPTVSVTATPVTGCFGGTNGTATATASGGTGTLIYAWNTTPVQTTPTASGLAAGSYVVTVTDASKCLVKSSVTITQPAAITASVTALNASSCSATDGSITANISGGTPPYSYSWSNNKTTANISGLAVGTYTLTVKDANNCIQSATGAVNCTGASLTVSANGKNVTCNGGINGAATATATGTPPYTYTWSTSPVQHTATATGLMAGTYTVTVTDANETKTATVTITSPAAIVANTTATDVSSCSAADGSITANISGGTPPYMYSWSNGSGTKSISGLSTGSYTLTVMDANGCKQVTSNTVSWSGAISIGSAALPEGFENNTNLPIGWTLDNPDNDAAWEVVTTVSHTGSNAIGFNNCQGNGAGTSMAGTKDRFMTTAYNFPNSIVSASLSFDLAYAVLNYKNQLITDSLAILYSTDCGSTWHQLYLKGGSELSAIKTTVSCWTPGSNDWRTETINLEMIKGENNVMFAFENRSNWGEWIYIDNINISVVTDITTINPLADIKLFPNPASSSITIEGEHADKIGYFIYNVVGLVVKTGDIEANGNNFTEKIQLNDFSKGMYFITFSDRKNTWTKKFNVQ